VKRICGTTNVGALSAEAKDVRGAPKARHATTQSAYGVPGRHPTIRSQRLTGRRTFKEKGEATGIQKDIYIKTTPLAQKNARIHPAEPVFARKRAGVQP